ncbi:coiled-coil domain-containing protein 125-like isoform X2 [Glandiceps talaboti]
MGTVRRALSLPLPGQNNTEDDEEAKLDDSCLSTGDLGLGYGLRPGGIPVRTIENDSESVETFLASPSSLKQTALRWNSAKSPTRTVKSKRTRRKISESDCDAEEEFPIFDGITMGTSMRQQRKLYEHGIEEIIKHKGSLSVAGNCPELGLTKTNDKLSKLDQQILHQKLTLAQEEVEILRNELEAFQRQLDSKYRAIRILQSQALLAQANQLETTVSTEAAKKKLETDVNSLQFELEAQNGSMMLSEQTWADRFDRVCLENAALMATLRAKADELSKVHAEKNSVARERDELIAMMDVKERLQYEKQKSTSSDNYMVNSVAELSVLGACHCRVTSPEPCSCARAAANLKRENSRLHDKIEQANKNVEESQVVADAYRIAFEEQLAKNKTLNKKIAEWLQSKHKPKTRRRGLKWIDKLEQLTNGNGNKLETRNGTSKENGSANDSDTSGSKSYDCSIPLAIPEDEDSSCVVTTMTELLNDKCEALAHQKMVARMLARKTQDLEESMNKLNPSDK